MISDKSKDTGFSYYYRYLDIFGIPNRLYFDEEYTYRTPIGATIAIFLTFLLILLSVGEVLSTFRFDASTVQTETVITNNPGNFSLDS
jgi:hypothetical protein